jgi:hypothetical protein
VAEVAGDLAEVVPVLDFRADAADIVDCCLDSMEHDWLVLVDEHGQPARLVERAALLRGEPFEHDVLCIDADDSPASCARRAMARMRSERFRPLACCAADGRFVGLVRLDRVIAALVD